MSSIVIVQVVDPPIPQQADGSDESRLMVIVNVSSTQLASRPTEKPTAKFQQPPDDQHRCVEVRVTMPAPGPLKAMFTQHGPSQPPVRARITLPD